MVLFKIELIKKLKQSSCLNLNLTSEQFDELVRPANMIDKPYEVKV